MYLGATLLQPIEISVFSTALFLYGKSEFTVHTKKLWSRRRCRILEEHKAWESERLFAVINKLQVQSGRKMAEEFSSYEGISSLYNLIASVPKADTLCTLPKRQKSRK